MTLRIDAGLNPSRFDRASVREPTGSPVEIKVSTRAVRISRSRFPILGSAGIYFLSVVAVRAAPVEDKPLPFILPNYFRCRSLAFGPKSQSRADSRNSAGAKADIESPE